MSFDEIGPAVGIALNQLAKLLGRAVSRIHALRLECFLYFFTAQDDFELFVESLNQFIGRVFGCKNALPHIDIHFARFGLSQCGHIGQKGVALVAANSQSNQFAGFDLWQRNVDRQEHGVHLAS